MIIHAVILREVFFICIFASVQHVQPFLGAVTYGPSGTEFRANGCNITVPHSQIACFTAPGTGRVLRWLVIVGSQISELSTATTSYAAPTITSISPRNGPTVGDSLVTITGYNFGLAWDRSKAIISVNNAMLTRPSLWNAWVGSKLAGSASPSSDVDDWVSNIPSFVPLSSQRQGIIERLTFRIPPGYGANAEIFISVDGIPSQNASFTYDAPIISNLAPDRKYFFTIAFRK